MATSTPNKKASGYNGIWFTLGQFDSQYGDKYSGGLGTYTAKHVPLAVYAPAADKTFFVYGGRSEGAAPHHLLSMASYFDHGSGLVPRPTIVHTKAEVDDPHHVVEPTSDADRCPGVAAVGQIGLANFNKNHSLRI